MSTVTLAEFQRLSIKVGKVVAAEKVAGRARLLKLQVDVGDRVLQLVAGGGEYYTPEHFIGKNVVVVTNLEPKVIAGIKSEGMLLAADHQGKPLWLTVEEDVPPGTIVR